jgi:uncharacterized phage infection (PIP) family protein YhgE
MSLQYKLDSIEDIPKAQQKMYTETDDGFVLDVEGIEVPDVSGLKSALDKERGRAKDAEKALSESQKKAKKEKDEAARLAGDIETVEENLREHYQGDIDSLTDKIKARDQKLAKVLLRDEAHRIAADIAVDTDAIEVVAEWIQHRIGIEENDGDFQVIVTGESSGLSLKEFTEGLTKQKSLSRLLKASNGTGGGSAGPSSGGTAKPKSNIGGTRAERVASISQQLTDVS